MHHELPDRNKMNVIKRSRQDSTADLVAAIQSLVPLLKDQKESAAAESLEEAATKLKAAKPETGAHKEAIAQIIDAFEGEHELMAYTFQREGAAGQWTEVEQLSHASTRVLSLARRMS